MYKRPAEESHDNRYIELFEYQHPKLIREVTSNYWAWENRYEDDIHAEAEQYIGMITNTHYAALELTGSVHC